MNIPEVRFPEFTEEWEKQKLSNILEFEYGMNAAGKEFDGENKYIRITDIEESSRKFLQTKLVSPEGKVTEKYRVKFGDILFARTGASTGKTYKYIDNDGKIYFAGFLIRGRVDKKTSVDFIFYLTLNYKYKSWINVMSMRSGQPGINAKEYGSYEFRIPKIEEQQKIGDFFTLLDKRIEQQEQKIALLKDYKKAMMQKIFSQKIRFKDENGNDYPDWEEKKLGEIGKFLNNRREAITEALRKNGKYPYYGATGIIDSVEEYIFDQEIILLGEDGAKWGENEESAFYVNHKCWVNNHAHVIEVNGNSVFLKEYLNFLELRRYVSGNAPAKLTLENARKILLNTPSFQEQEKIAFFLTSINKRIEKQENTLDKMQEYKEALLHKIFI